ncbi:MAG: DUF5615 family PIN-like protein [bacterium]
MRFKLDENFDQRVVPALVEAGHDVSTVRDEGLSGSPDDEVFGAAVGEKRTLMTLDLDFSSPLRFPPRGTEGVIVVRVRRPLLSLIERTIMDALPQLQTGHVRESCGSWSLAGSGNTHLIREISSLQPNGAAAPVFGMSSSTV